MPTDKLARYRDMRDFERTPEPSGAEPVAEGNRFVVQEHHARRLHWDFRLERDGVLVSWAVPRGIPPDPATNHLAVPTEDHPLSYLDFEGDIPKGEYGGGHVSVWDRGTYEVHKWSDREVMVTLHGDRVEGRYVLFKTGKDWMMHRMDPPQDPGREPMPSRLEPMKATSAALPADDEGWAYEIKWDGVRAVAFSSGGRIVLQSRSLREITPQYPEIRPLGAALGAMEVILDGEIVALDDTGRPSFERLQQRMHVGSEAAVRRLTGSVPVVYMVFDLLWRDGHSTMGLPYEERRRLLDELGVSGPHWQAPRFHVGDGAVLHAATVEQGLEGVVAKRLDSIYEPGRRSRAWLKVKNRARQEVVVGGWLPGERSRTGRIGALLAGVWQDGKLRYVGRVGSGFTDRELTRVAGLLEPLTRADPPFDPAPPAPVRKLATWVEPKLVAEVEFGEWTRSGTLRAPAYKGLRDDVDPGSVVREGA